ncbi:MAG: 50S ribosomal protein L32e [Candidatus Thermoplasmatota archaeon]|nr:50S ribosomal protein L32e [Candidatus Thermoplasmatota archaeon]MDI6856002.1 50S ribosomal protein L32e [Candidatus Thermoplasmatota archaeon]
MAEEEKKEVKIVEKELPKITPKLTKELKQKLELRKIIKSKKPNFKRQEWFRYKRLGEKWRSPKGIHSKLKRHFKYRIDVPSIGYGSPKLVRGLHNLGFKEVVVHNIKELESINPKLEAARIAHNVGTRKRLALEKRADELAIRVLNRSEK